MRLFALSCALVVALSASSTVRADQIVYNSLGNKPGAVSPPDYGLRLDKMFSRVYADPIVNGDGTSNKLGFGGNGKRYLFDFNETNGNGIDLTYTIDTVAKTANLSGTIRGGLDYPGNSYLPWESDIWQVDFTWRNITITNATTGHWTDDWGNDQSVSVNSTGTLTLISLDDDVLGLSSLNGTETIDLIAKNDPNRATKFAPDGFTDGFTESWIYASSHFGATPTHTHARDFAFRAVPEPGSLTALAVGLLCFGMGTGRRRRD